ncbi:MAG: tyrosine-type recombinase/integrase [Bacteroidales bacterium]|nr:tyrosine-type recombinase/integrase [Bacteroidales bacterium]
MRWNSRKQEHVFLGTVYPYKPLTAGGIYNFVKKNLKQEGIILKHYGAHCLRHSCATHLINSGHTMKEVADLLEHQNITTTAIYAKVDMKSLRKVADMSWEGLL